MEDEDKGNILKSSEDKEAKVIMRSTQARERFLSAGKAVVKVHVFLRSDKYFDKNLQKLQGFFFCFAVLFFVAVFTTPEITFFTPIKLTCQKLFSSTRIDTLVLHAVLLMQSLL